MYKAEAQIYIWKDTEQLLVRFTSSIVYFWKQGKESEDKSLSLKHKNQGVVPQAILLATFSCG